MTQTIDKTIAHIGGMRPAERERLRAHCDLLGRMERCALRAEDIAAHAHQALDAVCKQGGTHGAEDLVAILQIASDIRDTLRQPS
ncbi:MAG: hypothetical protein EPN34_03150 [Burkholderiaceae bacterium]|nr:MAG: hypothetical protein EPN34_03150 [Burkholderiaceae bacterium]